MPAAGSFPLIGEPLALDLLNTRACRNGAVVDLLDAPAALREWLSAQAERIAWQGSVRSADFEAVCVLRDAIDELVSAHGADRRPAQAALGEVNAALRFSGEQPQLRWGAAGPRLKTPPATARRAALLNLLARSALELLTGPDAARIRVCAHPECILRFVARNPRRRWCDSAVCGNRARVARHYIRHGHEHESRQQG